MSNVIRYIVFSLLDRLPLRRLDRELDDLEARLVEMRATIFFRQNRR